MTIANTESQAGPFYPNGATTVFPFDFKAFAKAELRVFTVDGSGVETDISPSLYNVTLNPNGGGSVVIAPPLPNGTNPLYIESDPAFTQNINFENQSAFRAPVHTEGLDRGAARDIWLRGRSLRALMVPPSEMGTVLPSAAVRAGRFLGFDVDGNAYPASGTGNDPALRTDLANASLGGSLLNWLRNAPSAVARSIADVFQDRTSVMDFIPLLERIKIRLRTSTADHTAYFQAAAVAVNGGVVVGPGTGGTVLVPCGTYNVGSVGMRDTHFVGESRDGTVIKATAGGNIDGSVFVFDATLERDGVTSQTYGNGSVNCMTIDIGPVINRSGVRTFGGGQFMKDVWVKGGLVGFAIGLPIRCVFDGLRADSCRIKGFYTYSHPGDTATSTTFNSCQAVSCYRGWHITQMSYSTWNSCVGELSTEINWFVEGNANGVPNLNSLTFNACGHEGPGVPFYFRKCRDFVILSPRVIAADGTSHLMTLDDFSGTILNYSTPGAPAGGKSHLDIINHGSGQGSIILVGCTVSLANFATQVSATTLIGTILNGGALATSGYTLAIDNATAAQRAFFDILNNLDGYSGVRLNAVDGTRLLAARRVGGVILSSNGPMNVGSAFGAGDVHLYWTSDNKLHVEGKRPDGVRIQGEVTLTSVTNPA